MHTIKRGAAIACALLVLMPAVRAQYSMCHAEGVPLRVAAVCMQAEVDKESNLETFHSYMRQASEAGAHLVVLPQQALQSSPSRGPATLEPTAEERAYTRETAEPIPGPSTDWLVGKARDVQIFAVFGMTELGEDESLYSTSVLIGPEDILGAYRAYMLWDGSHGGNEDQILRAGPTKGAVVDTPLGKIGLMVGLDLLRRFGGMLADSGADLLVTVASWGDHHTQFYRTGSVGNATRANRWHVVANQHGQVGHNTGYGHSRIIDSSGEVVAETGAEEGMVISEVGLLIDPAVLDRSGTAVEPGSWGTVKRR